MPSIRDFEENEVVGFCPECHHELVIRNGKYGKFIGCTNFPKCRKTYTYGTFRVSDEILELKTLEKIDDFRTIKKILDNTLYDRVKTKAETKIIRNHFCECGEKVSCDKIYRTTPDYPHYLKQYTCPKCGTYVTTETLDYASFCRMGKLDSNRDDSHITGGYWI